LLERDGLGKNPDHLAAPVMAQDSPDTTAQSGIYNPKDQQVAALQTRLVPFLNEQGIERYHAVKAAAWLTYAAHEEVKKCNGCAKRGPCPGGNDYSGIRARSG
jgi:hypothetical protein